MVPKRGLHYGFNGCDSPFIPRAPRSVRGRGPCSRASKDGQISAFELLATLAGKLLQESESSSASSSAAAVLGLDDHRGVGKDAIINPEEQHVDKHDEHGTSEESVFISRISSNNCSQRETNSSVPEEALVERASAACSLTVYSAREEQPLVKLPGRLHGGSPDTWHACDAKLGSNIDRPHHSTRVFDGLCGNSPPAPGSSNGTVELSPCQNSAPDATFVPPKNKNNIGTKDDDDIFSPSSQPDTKMKATPSPTCYGDRRIRKLLPSKYWKVGPKVMDSEVGNAGVELKSIHPAHNSFYERERSQRDTPFKKRKLYDQSSILTYKGGNGGESADIDITKRGWDAEFHTATPASASMVGHKKSPSSSSNPNVKFTIKSFKVPELLIEVPESTTVGSLKRTMVDAVTAMLGGGLRVGVLLHGKRVRDDNRTLQEAGISMDDNTSALGFLLEPRTPAQPSTSVLSKTCANRAQISPNKTLSLSSTPDKSSIADSGGSCGDSSKDLLGAHPCSTSSVSGIKTESDSRALMPVPESTKEPLPVVPVNLRPRRPEIGQRRTRRPFSVPEVEALVEAVEKLGTGRWRDVKLCSFENAKHRTYVDLKDKWKTLVHTARISPQQRRGEPVPQELLDRVLDAHAYWTQNQTKQHGKH